MLRAEYDVPILVSTHPRTRKRIESLGDDEAIAGIRFHPPFGFHDYIKLQMESKLVLSDSGTISEESSMLGFPAITLRDAIERPEALDVGVMITAGVDPQSVVESAWLTLQLAASHKARPIPEYEVDDASRRTVAFIYSTVRTHHSRLGLRGRT